MSKPIREKENKSTYKILLLIIFAGLSVRLLWMMSQTANIEGEGAEYARLAENLLRGHGYVGIFGHGTQLIFPPLYPLLIASFSSLTGDFELAGRLVSLITGTALVLPMFFIAVHMYRRGIALLAASLTAFHPLLIKLSADVYSEGTYIMLLVGGVYWGLRTFKTEESKPGILAGVCFGLAYLTRPEAIVYPFLVTAALFVSGYVTNQKVKRALICSLRVIIPFFLVASPYIVFLSVKTGELRFEGKSTINYVIGQRMIAGMGWSEASFGIDKNLNEEGPGLNWDVKRPANKPSLRDASHYVLMSAKSNLKTMYQIMLSSRAFGSPLLIALVIVGLFRTIWSHERIIHEGFIALIVLSVCLILLSVQHFFERFAFALLPFLILWASKGIVELSEWVEGTVSSLNRKFFQNGKVIRIGAQWALSMMLLVYATTNYVDEFKKMQVQIDPIKEAGQWLHSYIPGPKKVMASSSVIPYYAGGTWLPLPYAESSLALKYIHYKRPSFIVLASDGADTRPYLRQWILEGIRDENAVLIYDKGKTDENRIRIYQWNSQSTEGLARTEAR